MKLKGGGLHVCGMTGGVSMWLGWLTPNSDLPPWHTTKQSRPFPAPHEAIENLQIQTQLEDNVIGSGSGCLATRQNELPNHKRSARIHT